MRRVIGIDIHRTFGEVVIWEEGWLRHAGRVVMTRMPLEGFGKGLRSTDEVVIEAIGHCMAVSRVLSPFVTLVVIANPLQVKAIAHAHVKTDKIDAGTLASLHAAGHLLAIWTPDAATERMRSCMRASFHTARMPICSVLSAEVADVHLGLLYPLQWTCTGFAPVSYFIKPLLPRTRAG